MATPSAEIRTTWLRTASESPVTRSRTSLAEFVAPPENTTDLSTFHQTFDTCSYSSSRRETTPSLTLPTSSPRSLYMLSDVRTTPPAAVVVERVRDVDPS